MSPIFSLRFSIVIIVRVAYHNIIIGTFHYHCINTSNIIFILHCLSLFIYGIFIASLRYIIEIIVIVILFYQPIFNNDVVFPEFHHAVLLLMISSARDRSEFGREEINVYSLWHYRQY